MLLEEHSAEGRTTNNDGIAVGQQGVCAAEGVLCDVVWLEGVVCHVVDGCHLCLGAIEDLRISGELNQAECNRCISYHREYKARHFLTSVPTCALMSIASIDHHPCV